ncbi:MAG: amphi-Trp domain-containing protein [Nitrospirae bacterium]|nr:amphi-Trp domain-containing protein [Nitrospirota bacterium]
MTKKRKRDVERACSTAQFAAKLRRLADAVEKGRRFEIQIAGQRIHVPAGAEFSVEHEREGMHNEIEFQIRWHNA